MTAGGVLLHTELGLSSTWWGGLGGEERGSSRGCNAPLTKLSVARGQALKVSQGLTGKERNFPVRDLSIEESNQL